MRSKYIIIVIAFVLLFIGFQYNRMKKVTLSDFQVFYNSELDGYITYISVSGGLNFFKLNNSEVKYSFMPTPVNNDKLFYNAAQKGDRIKKPAHSDTLKLYKSEKVFLYTFKNWNE